MELNNNNSQPAPKPVQAAVPAQPSAPATSPAPRITLHQLVDLCIEKEASDLHFREGGRVALRIGGKITYIENVDVLSKEEALAMVQEMISEPEMEQLSKQREVDFSYTHTNGINFRANVFYQQGKLAGVMRMISKHIPSLEELGIPDGVKEILGRREGLILVGGTAGSGKSTTIEAMLSYLNESSVKHILTIENPIEHIFSGDQSIFTQREIGKDTLTYERALDSAVREDVNVVMVSEINSASVMNGVLNLVETGHLVISSVLAGNASQTIEKLASFYPLDQRRQAQFRIADSLSVLLVQDLVDRQDKSGRVALFELMYMNQSIRNTIRQGKFEQLRAGIQAANNQGMMTMDSYAYGLAEQGIISQEQVAQLTEREEG